MGLTIKVLNANLAKQIIKFIKRINRIFINNKDYKYIYINIDLVKSFYKKITIWIKLLKFRLALG